MKLAVFSCVHGHSGPLSDVLDHARRKGAEELYCLGDLCGPGPDPAGTVKLLRRNAVQCVTGEWDLAVASGLPLPGDACGETGDEPQRSVRIQETIRSLDDVGLGWLRSLPASLRIVRAGRSLVFAHGHSRQQRLDADWIATGHLHASVVAKSSAGTHVFPGAVGGVEEASYALVDDTTLEVRLHRVLVDLATERR